MPKFSVTVPHDLTEEQAKERLSHFSEKIQEHYKDQIKNFTQSWQGNLLNFAFRTFGFDISGKLNVATPEVKLDGDLPFAAMMFKGKIEQAIRDELTKLLGVRRAASDER
jgi:hypothetical protein